MDATRAQFRSILDEQIKRLDKTLSEQLAAILHHPQFQELEATWRGLHNLVMNTETSPRVKIKILNASKKVLFRDLEKAAEFDQSALFQKVYADEFGAAEGEPYAVLIGAYEFSHGPDDVALLNMLAHVSAAAFCPFITAPAPAFFGFDTWTELSCTRDLSRIIESVAYAAWRSFRSSEDANFVALVLPRVLSRLPYGASTSRSAPFPFEEAPLNEHGEASALPHAHYAWMNASYVLAARMAAAFDTYGWCAAFLGFENGGKTDGLPRHFVTTADGDTATMGPTETAIDEMRNYELTRLGFVPLHRDRGDVVLLSAQTTRWKVQYDDPLANANTSLTSSLPFIMTTSRFMHYLRLIARDLLSSGVEAPKCQERLNQWINQYVGPAGGLGPETTDIKPLASAHVEIKKSPEWAGASCEYEVTAYLRPWFQTGVLTVGFRMIGGIPKPNG